MTRKSLLPLALVATLAACNQAAEEPAANNSANAVAEVVLPPSIVASHKYRCKDNSILSIDWLSDGKANSARLTPEVGAPVTVAQAEKDGDYTAADATLKGDPKATEITFNGQSCNR